MFQQDCIEVDQIDSFLCIIDIIIIIIIIIVIIIYNYIIIINNKIKSASDTLVTSCAC